MFKFTASSVTNPNSSNHVQVSLQDLKKKKKKIMGREVIFLHLGQAGVQLGNALWELFCLEHSVYPNGLEAHPTPDKGEAIFFLNPNGKSIPRAVFCDLEPTPIDEIRIGSYRQLFNPDMMVSGKEDAASNFARGYYSVGNQMSEIFMDCTRRCAETCEALQGFAIFRSYGGGTGSGFVANVVNKLKADFHYPILEFSIYPSPRISPLIVEPYNTILTTHATINNMDCSFLFDNEAIYDICSTKLNVNDPTYTNLNRLIAQVVSSVTASIRFSGPLNVDLNQILTNLIPYKRIHFPLVSYAPILPSSKVMHEDISAQLLVNECFHPMNTMVKCNPREGRYMACCLLFRGDVAPTDINKAIERIKGSSGAFVDYTPKPFKVGLNYQPPLAVPGGDLARVNRSVAMLSNSSAITPAWTRMNSKFSIMFDKRAFVHHYVGEGMEEQEFVDSQEDIKALEKDYALVGS